MIRSPATHAMTNSKVHGLRLVRIYFGVVREVQGDPVVVSGDTVMDVEGRVRFFVGLGADRRPILANTESECEDGRESLRLARLHVESVIDAR